MGQKRLSEFHAAHLSPLRIALRTVDGTRTEPCITEDIKEFLLPRVAHSLFVEQLKTQPLKK
jgi:hypothetical protein